MNPKTIIFSEPSPSTVNYRTTHNKRHPLESLINGTLTTGWKSEKKITFPVGGTKLNWFNGVLIPVILNMFGAIMFLRIGWVVGQAGLWLGTLVIIVANTVVVLTALSLCAICTNGEVKGGGIYFLISRSLGPVFDGTIGIMFFLAQAVAMGLHVVGFAEGVTILLHDQNVDYFTGSLINDTRVIGLVASVVLLAVSLIGIGWYAKTQTALLIILLLSVMSVFVGAFFPEIPNGQANKEAGFYGFGEVRNLKPNFQVDPTVPSLQQSFFTVLAVFFPAVTGIMAGTNLSGDLDNPSTAIPKGTLCAICFTFVSYVALIWFTGITCVACSNGDCTFGKLTESLLNDDNFVLPQGGLLYNKLIMKNMSLWEPLVYIGVFAATLSSALASLVGAPRILQSLAADQVFPFRAIHFFSKGRGKGNEPIRGYFLTFAICCSFVSIGKLDLIAPIISNIFIISYALTNYACFASSVSDSPNWRPSFRYYSKYSALLGTFVCVISMFLIAWMYALITCFVAFSIMYYLHKLNPDKNWGEISEAKKYSKALDALEVLQMSEKVHVKTFRPQFLLLSGNIYDRIWLIKFVSLMQTGGGILICGDVILRSELPKIEDQEQVTEKIEKIKEMNSTDSGSLESGSGSHGIYADCGENSLLSHLVIAEEANSSPTDQCVGTGLKCTVDVSVKEVGVRETVKQENAQSLIAELEVVMKRRCIGEAFLNNKTVWGKRCKGAFYEVLVETTLLNGFERFLQSSGIGKMRPNTIVIGFKSTYRSDSFEEVANFERIIRTALSVHIGLMVVRDQGNVFDMNLSGIGRSGFLQKFPGLVFNENSDKSDADEIPANLNIYSNELNSEFIKSKRESELGDEGPQTILDMNFEPPNQHDKKVEPDNAITLNNVGLTLKTVSHRERVERYVNNDVEFINSYESSLPEKLNGKTIDVWWLADDGGLTVLLPHLLLQHPIFKNHKLRVMAVTTKFQSAEETSRLKETELRMVHLLNKFRIKATTVGVDLKLDQELKVETKKRFEECLGVSWSDLNKFEMEQSQYHLRVSEELQWYSKEASAVFVILPIPNISLRVKLYTTWLDMLSHEMPPMIMMRGNNENVLTFFC